MSDWSEIVEDTLKRFMKEEIDRKIANSQLLQALRKRGVVHFNLPSQPKPLIIAEIDPVNGLQLKAPNYHASFQTTTSIHSGQAVYKWNVPVISRRSTIDVQGIPTPLQRIQIHFPETATFCSECMVPYYKEGAWTREQWAILGELRLCVKDREHVCCKPKHVPLVLSQIANNPILWASLISRWQEILDVPVELFVESV
jgi:hypothetical protein